MSDIYHTLNRGVDRRIIFLDDADRLRFIHNMFEFNDVEPVSSNFYAFRKFQGLRNPEIEKRKRRLLVRIHCFILMPNHYHLLLSPLVENGVFQFMKKLNTGYANYFNKRYIRKGALFEGRYKSIIIKNEAHFSHMPFYIHSNCLDLIDESWREFKIKDFKKALEFLNNYRWSSHLDYLGKKNFSSVTQRGLFLDIFGGTEGYKKTFTQWLKDRVEEPVTDKISRELLLED